MCVRVCVYVYERARVCVCGWLAGWLVAGVQLYANTKGQPWRRARNLHFTGANSRLVCKLVRKHSSAKTVRSARMLSRFLLCTAYSDRWTGVRAPIRLKQVLTRKTYSANPDGESTTPSVNTSCSSEAFECITPSMQSVCQHK